MTYLKDRFNACAATVECAGKSHARNELSVWRSLALSFNFVSFGFSFSLLIYRSISQRQQQQNRYAPLYTTTSRFTRMYGCNVSVCASIASVSVCVCLCVACGFALDFCKLLRSLRSPREKTKLREKDTDT